MKKCPECKGELIIIEYVWGFAWRYDGASEKYCHACKKRWGRWCGRELQKGEHERPFCDKSDSHDEHVAPNLIEQEED